MKHSKCNKKDPTRTIVSIFWWVTGIMFMIMLPAQIYVWIQLIKFEGKSIIRDIIFGYTVTCMVVFLYMFYSNLISGLLEKKRGKKNKKV